MKERFPELSEEIELNCGSRTGAGRPRIEEEYPELLKTIVDIVAPEAAADVGRRPELLRDCISLDDLCAEIEKRIDGILTKELRFIFGSRIFNLLSYRT